MSTGYDTILEMTKCNKNINFSPDALQGLVEYCFLYSYHMLTLFTYYRRTHALLKGISLLK